MSKTIILSEAQFKDFVTEAITNKEIAEKAKAADKNPTEAQKKANNYAHGHVNVRGFDISIENPKGSYRCGKDRNGKEWKVKMNNHYGYFTKTLGKDGDHIDVFLGSYLKFDTVFVVDQVNAQGEFDESKVMLGFKDEESAKKAYLSNYSKDWKGFKKITGVPVDFFKEWLYDGYKQRKPFADYVDVKSNKA